MEITAASPVPPEGGTFTKAAPSKTLDADQVEAIARFMKALNEASMNDGVYLAGHAPITLEVGNGDDTSFVLHVVGNDEIGTSYEIGIAPN